MKREAINNGTTAAASAPLRLYLAGKIGHTDWRHTIVPGLRGAWGGLCGQPSDPSAIRPIRFFLGGRKIEYSGPYFVGCDHGCFHGPGSHGVMSFLDDEQERARGYEARRDAFFSCMEWLEHADAVFAHIDSPDAHGTMFELGRAYDRIPIYLNFTTDELADECWFAGADVHCVTINPDPRAALIDLLRGSTLRFVGRRSRGGHHD